MNFFENNLAAITQKNPVLGAKLLQLQENKKYEVYIDEKDPININIYDKERDFIFYKSKPVEEIQEQFETLLKKYARHPLMWFFGVSNGLLLKMFLNVENKTLFVFEKEIELLWIALNLFDFSKDIENNRIFFFLLEDLSYAQLDEMFSNPDWKVFLKTYNLETTLDSYYLTFFQEDVLELNRQITETIKVIIIREGNDANDSLIGLDHHLQHIPKMVRSYPLKEVAAKVKHKYAVIVSTGPSLAKQLPLLKAYKEYVTILCIDASLPILQKEGIAPDFVFSIERVKETAKFFEELDRELLEDTVFIPTSISHPQTLKNLEGMQLCISMRPFGYTMMFGLHKWGYIGIGMSAANMAFEFAYEARFEKIALIGQDLAFGEDGTTHSKGALYGEVEENYFKQEELYVKGYYGKPVKTTKTWNLFLSSFKKDIPVVNEKGIKVYNCTEGGAYIEGAEHIPFEKFLHSLPKNQKERLKFSSIPESSQKHLIMRSKKLICLYMERLKTIKTKIEEVFLEVMETIESLEELNAKEKLEEIDFDALSEVISKIDSVKDLYEEDKAMRKFGNITSPLIVNAELELACIMVRESDDEDAKKVKMIDWIYEHKSWLFFLAGALENIVFLLEKNYTQYYKNLE